MLQFLENESLANYSTFGIGGPARFFVKVHTVEEMREAILSGHPYLVIGKGSNCLFHDKGFNGLVILNKIDFFEDLGNGKFHVGAGFSFSLLGVKTAQKGFSGLEFASGIPATVGGAVFMNAGANGTETCKSLASVDYLNEKGELQFLPKEELFFSYRTSCFQNGFQKQKGAIVGATFQLEPNDTARKKQLEIIDYRKKTQPYGDKSAGCIFRNPTGGFAGKLIEEAGLKGIQIGGAEVSTMHANFIVNRKGATAEDVLALIKLIQTKVHLESEVRIISYDPLC